MKMLIVMALCALLAPFLAGALQAVGSRKNRNSIFASLREKFQAPCFANIADGTHERAITRLTDAAITTRFLLGKIGSDANHVAACGVADIPLGVITDEANAAEDPVAVALFGATNETRKAVASAAIAAGDFIVSAASGKVRTLPGAAGTYYIIGMALVAATADGDVIEFDSCVPVQRVVA